jgi:16S rRNA (adenine1518-N6/adenine1519-N6)-dimethyltransferase
VNAGFAQKRKQLHNSLTHGLHLSREEVLAGLSAAEIAPDRRPQTLSIEEWMRLSRALPL